MANFSLPKNYIFDNSNLTGAHIAQLVEHFHGKEEVACSIHAVGTIIVFFLRQQNSSSVLISHLKQTIFLFRKDS